MITLFFLEFDTLNAHLCKRRWALGSWTLWRRLRRPRPFHVWWQRGRGHTSRMLTGRPSSRPCVARRVRSRRRRRHSRRVGAGVNEGVSMLVGKLSLRLRCRLRSGLWYLRTHIHRVRRQLLFSDGREDGRRPNASTSGRPEPCAWYRAVEFFRMTSTTCRPSSIDGLGAPPLSRSERCFACVRFRTNFDSVMVSCSCLESDCGDGWDSAARRSTASVLP